MSAADLVNDALKASARTQTPVSTDPLTAISQSVDASIDVMARATAVMDYQQARIAELQGENLRLRQLVACYRAATLKDITR